MGTHLYLYMNIEPSALMYDLYIKVCKCFTMLNVTLSPGGTTTNPYSAAHLQPNPSFPLSHRPSLPSGPPLHLHKPPPCPPGTPGPTPTTLTNWRGHKANNWALSLPIVEEHLALWPRESESLRPQPGTQQLRLRALALSTIYLVLSLQESTRSNPTRFPRQRWRIKAVSSHCDYRYLELWFFSNHTQGVFRNWHSPRYPL